jgi:hypothetical protein
MWELGDIAIEKHEIVYLKEKCRIPIVVMRKGHPIIIQKEGSYSWLEIQASNFNQQTVLCFNDYNELKDAESRTPKVSAIYCYGR